MIIPLVSICMPAYNAEKYIEETITCLLNQSYKNIEIIIVDDCSTDKTWEILHSLNNNKVSIHRQALNKGASAARNVAYQNSTGKYIVFFDADDLINTTFIESQLKSLKDTDSVVISTWGRFYGNNITTFSPDKQVIPHNMDFYAWIINYWTHNQHTTPPGRLLIPKKLIERAGLWNENLSLNDDFDFYTRIFVECRMIIYNPDAIFYYRSGISGLSSKKTAEAYNSLYQSIDISLINVLKKFPDDVLIKKACASILKQFIYQVYPYCNDLLKRAEKSLYDLGGSEYLFPAGGFSLKLSKFLGWKISKKIKILLKNTA